MEPSPRREARGRRGRRVGPHGPRPEPMPPVATFRGKLPCLGGATHQSFLNVGVALRSHHKEGMQSRARGVSGGRAISPWGGPSPLTRGGSAAPFTGAQHAKVPETRGWLLGAITQKLYKGERGGLPKARCTALGLCCMAR